MKTLLTTLLTILLSFSFSAYTPAPKEVNLVTTEQTQTKVLICTGKYAKKYHSHQCHGLKRCKGDIVSVTLSEAKNNGYTPCGNCY